MSYRGLSKMQVAVSFMHIDLVFGMCTFYFVEFALLDFACFDVVGFVAASNEKRNTLFSSTGQLVSGGK